MAAVPLPSAGYFSGSITNSQAKTAQDNQLAFLRQSIGGVSALGAFTLASDAITPDGSSASFSVDTESAAAADNLGTIVQTNTTDGQLLLITQANSGRVVTVKHGVGGTGQILLRGAVDMVLNTDMYIWLQRVGTNWVEVNRTPSLVMEIQLGTAGGTANSMTATPNTPIPGYRTTMSFKIQALLVNTNSTVVLNVSALGTKNIKKYIGGSKVGLGIGDIQIGMPMELYYDGTDLIWLNPPAYSHSADIASSGTLNLNNSTGDLIDVTGTTTITAITLNEGQERTVRFTGALTLTHGASLVLPNAGANILTAAGDFAIFRAYASGVVRCVAYNRLNGQALVTTASVAYSAIAGFIPSISNVGTTTAAISFSAGQAASVANDAYITKGSTTAWAVSNGNAINGYVGGTSLPASATLHFFICSGSSGTGIFADTSLSSPSIPAGYSTYYRRVASIKTNGSSQLIPYVAVEVEGGALHAMLNTEVLDFNSTVTTTAALQALSVPLDIKVRAKIRAIATTNAYNGILISSPDAQDVAPTISGSGGYNGTAPGFDLASTSVASGIMNLTKFIITNTSGQVRLRSTASTAMQMVTSEFIDFRR